MTEDWIDLGGKVALVTGASRGTGIGRGIARVLHAAGAQVVVGDVDLAGAEQVAKQVEGEALSLDVTEPRSVQLAIDRVLEERGRLDILVNNAGVYREYGGPIVDMPHDVWRRLMAVNLDGVFHCSRAACRAMVESKTRGRIVNIASVQAVTPGVGVSYDASKAAVVQFTRTLALEMAPHGINVNSVAPGATWVEEGDSPPVSEMANAPPTGDPLADTVANRIGRIPLQRWGRPEEVGKAVLFLVSPLADYVTGIYLPVDGGWLLL